ncbi:Phage major capsid protein [Candidatus Arthromitus sp. SFB-mouse-NL]|uniref:phage major capsid protein n=1 Tax=Candidatus Arthromitus sp. SFB-mouse-NL TaxID=1508644 RepID=UPI00049ABFA1|nr:phage major capsid protein [Candidatus Arthromitus sp. SFB-mouse-NL]AID44740.1 Phage major capsid protein [Candidatus Arthromitus sp. SFB-mouse-NL]
MSKRTVYEIKRELQNFNEQLQKLYSENVELALSNDSEGITRNKKDIDTITTSLEVLKGELERREKESIKVQINNDDPIICRGIYYKSIILGNEIPEDVKRSLFGANLTPSTGGEKLIPTTLANELLREPLKDNPLRSIMTITNTRGLEIQKVSYELEDNNFIKDNETAKELKLTGDKISFGRFKFKVKCRVSDTVLYGTNADLVSYIEGALKEGLAEKEKICIFKTTNSGEEHMNIYSSQNAIKEVEGEDLFKAIKTALSDLEDKYYERASIVMKRSDYTNMIDKLSNFNTDFYNKQPEQVLGVNVIFCEYAEKPIIGDFSQLHLNYDIDSVFDSGKDIENGQELFVLTAWADIRIKLKSAFRIAKVASTRSKKIEDK